MAFRQHGAAQQGAAGIEAAAGIANHPAIVPPAGIGGLLLGFHHQGHTAELVAAAPEAVAMPPLQHQIAQALHLQPAARLRHVFQHQTVQHLLTACLA